MIRPPARLSVGRTATCTEEENAPVSPVRTDVADVDLVEATRRGDPDAYAELWQRHSGSGRTVARSWSSLDADDLVAEAFTRIYDAIRSGGGPTGAFRPYLFTTIRNTAASWGRARHETNLETLESFEDPDSTEAASLEALDRSTTAQAFRALPTRWQEVLWYSEVERMSPQQIAPLIGMSANATAALAYRAREGLRQEWIRAHLRDASAEPACRWTVDRLAAYTRGKLRPRETAKLEAHLDECARCTIVAAEAREVGSRLALVLLPLAAGVGAATAYSAWLHGALPVVHLAAGAGVAAGAGAGAGATISGSASGSAAGVAGTAGAAGGGLSVGAGIGGLVLVAAAITAVIVLPNLGTGEPSVSAPMPVAAAPERPVAEPPRAAPAPAEAPVAEAPVPDAADELIPAPAPAPSPAPTPTPAPAAPPEVAPVPVDAIALAPIISLVDTAGGLVDPILTGTAEPGATVTVTGDTGGAWSTTADAEGAWSVLASGLPAGATSLVAAQTDVAGNVSAASEAIGVTLTPPLLELGGNGAFLFATLTGVAGADLEVLVDGVPFTVLTVDPSGTADYAAFLPGNLSVDVAVRYVADGRTGPAADAVRG
jgi:RNA polymerase sigma factor (sigma-70 family)